MTDRAFNIGHIDEKVNHVDSTIMRTKVEWTTGEAGNLLAPGVQGQKSCLSRTSTFSRMPSSFTLKSE